MKKLTIAMLVLVAAGLAFVAQSGFSDDRGQAAGEGRVVSALGVGNVQGERAFVHVTVLVGAGQDEHAAVDAALQEQGARRANRSDLESAEYRASGLVWNQFSDPDPNNNFVKQNYNPANDQTGGNGEGALLASQATWTNAASSFAFQYGGQTNRCPSLVKECPGEQAFDGLHDVGWLDLGRCSARRCTLGVTWYSTSIDEADMALTTRVSWSTGCTNVSGRYDAQTVLTHENGHVVGLGHSSAQQAVMYAYYGGARCPLHQDDIAGVSFLYP